MKVVIGNDHAGVDLKNLIIKTFSEIEFINVGTDTYDSCDYPDYIGKVAQVVNEKEVDFGIAICGTGIGASIVANKYSGIRAALCTNEFMARMSKRHNNANVLVLGSRVVGNDLAIAIINAYLQENFEGGRHERRLLKIENIENGKC